LTRRVFLLRQPEIKTQRVPRNRRASIPTSQESLTANRIEESLPTDYPDRITYVFRSNSLYNRRFRQRRQMKKLLGVYRKPVGEAKSSTKEDFLKHLMSEQIQPIQRVFRVSPGTFWRAAKGAAFLQLPPEFVQKQLEFGE
jgi:hypothetical protein